MSWQERLAQGVLVASACPKCKYKAWPPSKFCSQCLIHTEQKELDCHGTIIEYSKKDGEYFCLAEFGDTIRIIGSLKTDTTPKIGSIVTLDEAIMQDDAWSFKMHT